MSIEAMKQALEVLEDFVDDPRCQKQIDDASSALRQAIQEEALRNVARLGQEIEQEPVAWRAPNWGHSADEWVYRDADDPVLGLDGKPTPNNEPLYTAPQPQQAEKQEPVPWQGCDLDGMVEAFDRVIEAHFFRKNPFHNPIDADAQMALRILRGFIPYMKQYTTTQPQREWVGLTDGEVDKMILLMGFPPDWITENAIVKNIVRNLEAKLKEKNT